ncbi:MAG TPA: 3'-5' exonuclease [Cellvibrio sp.]|nr:3'-5' exonuclease [Cellvibrio sp.]
MRALRDVAPTAEQLGILSRNELGVEIIRGAAGSGKTTTALLRLRSLVGLFLSRRRRVKSEEPVRILVLTYNRTLRGYIDELARHQVGAAEVELEVSTFSKWATQIIPTAQIISRNERVKRIKEFGKTLPFDSQFLLDEVEYVMGRFTKSELSNYLTARRDGRGTVPRVEKPLRERILNEVIIPYQNSIDSDSLWDWNDFALFFSSNNIEQPYDIIICDEAQDLSANELRAIKNQLAQESSITFVLDTAQRIYARGYTWVEIGLTVRPEQVKRLSRNYRNTRQVAALASSVMLGIPADEDATMPDFSKSSRDGNLPILLLGRFKSQADFVINYIKKNIDLNHHSVAFLHPLGGGWFDDLKTYLNDAKLPFVEMTRKETWPKGNENIGLCTLHSSKGLEFDYVFILGLNAEVTKHGEEEEDDKLQTLRRLLAMGIGRARENVILGYKPGAASKLIDYLASDKVEVINV